VTKILYRNFKIKSDEIALFSVCEADPKSKTLLENSTVLSMMDFLSNKILSLKSYET
jgi:hypothetical protein